MMRPREDASMLNRLLLAAVAMAALWAAPAGATRICPDEAGVYSPMNCDLILPIDPNQISHECAFEDWWAWHTTGESDDPICNSFWDSELAQKTMLCRRLLAIDAGLEQESSPEVLAFCSQPP
jgi:hypothetical protein